jgi:hypothetical protein
LIMTSKNNFLQVVCVGSLLFISTACKDSNACADKYALNFTPGSTNELGLFCSYPTYRTRPSLLTTLAKEIKETSGLAYINGQLLTHNDRGGANILYVINQENGTVQSRITIAGATNTDWEDLAESTTHLYIGDMGNNDGDRKDLKIYKISKSKLSFQTDTQVQPDEVINFYYPEQSDFTAGKNHNFDCEAMIFFNDNLYLFSKNRLDKKCNVYKIPAKAGNHAAEQIDTFHSTGRITGAAISPDGNSLTLIGYDKKADCFAWVLSDFEDNKFFSGKKSYITFGPFAEIGQMEAVVYDGKGSLLLSSEKLDDLAPKLYKLSLTEL